MVRDLTEAILVFGCFLYPVLGQILPGEILNYDYGCFGDHDRYAYFKGNCSSSAVVAVSRVRIGAKVASMTMCQRTINSSDNSSFFDQCCKENSSSDCTNDFPYQNIYDCSGTNQCKLRVLRNIIDSAKCSNGTYGYSENGTNHSTYMIFDHYCVETANILACPSTSNVKGNLVYLQSDGYVKQSTKDCECYIETPNSTIVVYSVHNDLGSQSGLNGTCNDSASLVFKDRNGTIEYNRTCEGESKITNLFNSSSNYLSIIFNTSRGKNTGRFWLAFKASMSSTVTVQCSMRDSSEFQESQPGLPIVWIIVAVLGSLIFLIILLICCIKCCSDDPPDRSNKIQSNDIERTATISSILVNPIDTKMKLSGQIVSTDDTPVRKKKKRRKKSGITQKKDSSQPSVIITGIEDGARKKDETNSKNTMKVHKKKKRRKKRKHRSKTHEEQGRKEDASTENDAVPSKDVGKNVENDAESEGDTEEQNKLQYGREKGFGM